jgi:non-heme chloroperoxidase
MIHGMWGTGEYWENFKGFFEGKGYQCVVPTLRFHDMDPKAVPDPRLGRTSLIDYAEDLEKLIRELHATPILMGHSMGGCLAQILGSRELAKALVLLSPSPPHGIMALKPSVIKSFRSALTRWGFWRKPFRLTFGETAYSMLNRMPPENQKTIYDKFVYESGRVACEIGFWFFDSQGAAKVDESKVTCPVLIVAGFTPYRLLGRLQRSTREWRPTRNCRAMLIGLLESPAGKRSPRISKGGSVKF